MARHGLKAQAEVETAMQKLKRGQFRSGRAKATVTSREQAIAIGLSKARKQGGKVPKKKG